MASATLTSKTCTCLVRDRAIHARPMSLAPSNAHRSARSHVSSRSVVPHEQKHLTTRLASAGNGVVVSEDRDVDTPPTPVVKIDNMSDPFATIVKVSYGSKLGELLDTVAALKNLGLNISRAKLEQTKDDRNKNTFYITDATTSEKILKSARLEEIRMTIINNMLFFHPESAENLAAGQAASTPSRDITMPLGPRRRVVVPTTIEVRDAPNGSCSVLHIDTRDRPGLLVDIVSVLKDLNVNVVSAEVDTVGTQAKDDFFITYHGEALNPSMVQLVTNALQYYLSLAEVEKEESY